MEDTHSHAQRERQNSYLIGAGVFHYFSAEVATFDRPQILQGMGRRHVTIVSEEGEGGGVSLAGCSCGCRHLCTSCMELRSPSGTQGWQTRSSGLLLSSWLSLPSHISRTALQTCLPSSRPVQGPRWDRTETSRRLFLLSS